MNSTVIEGSAYLTPVYVKGEILQDDWNKMLHGPVYITLKIQHRAWVYLVRCYTYCTAASPKTEKYNYWSTRGEKGSSLFNKNSKVLMNQKFCRCKYVLAHTNTEDCVIIQQNNTSIKLQCVCVLQCHLHQNRSVETERKGRNGGSN